MSRFPADNPAHRRIVAQALGVVHVLISSNAAEYRLPQQADQRMAAVPAGLRISECLARHPVQPSSSSSSRYANNPASEVTADPRNQATVKIEPNNIRFCFTSRVFQEFPQSDDIKQPISESARELLTHCVIRRMRAYGKLPIGEKLEKPPTAGSKLPLSL